MQKIVPMNDYLIVQVIKNPEVTQGGITCVQSLVVRLLLQTTIVITVMVRVETRASVTRVM